MRIRFNNTPHHKKTSRSGMTLIEMLVAVAILSMIILAFGTILTQAQKVVKTSQANMRTNGTVAAIAQVIRQDLKQLTKDGFLCITQTKGTTSIPRLVFTTAGTTPSKTNNVTGQYGIPVYGTITNQLGMNSEYADLGTSSCLVCQKWVLDPNSTTTSGDVWGGGDLAYIQSQTRENLSNNFIGIDDDTGLLGAFPKADSDGLYVPPRNQDDLGRLWQVLSNETSSLSIMWTDGTKTDNVLNWYGILYNDFKINEDSKTGHKQVPEDADWADKNIGTVKDTEFEFAIPYLNNENNYRALWTHYDKSNWPKAIRISFVIYDKAMAEGMRADDETRKKRYEVICPIGK